MTQKSKNSSRTIFLIIWVALCLLTVCTILLTDLKAKSSFTIAILEKIRLGEIFNVTTELRKKLQRRCFPLWRQQFTDISEGCGNFGDKQNNTEEKSIDPIRSEEERLMGEKLSAMEFYFQRCDYLKEMNMTDFISASLDQYSNCSMLCPSKSPHVVGYKKPTMTTPSWDDLHQKYSMLKPGGRYRPPECWSRHKVAIIIPYRDREGHLKTLMYNFHAFLQRQQLQYGIFVIEQSEGGIFNRAMLLNIGYKEALAAYDSDCFIFHDVDHLPENDKNSYGCHSNPRQLAVAMSKWGYKPLYSTFFGGVSALSRRHMESTNGFSNKYFGWGAEDDDMWTRLQAKKYKVLVNHVDIGRYTTISHAQDKGNSVNLGRMKLLSKAALRMDEDGLNSLRYTVLKKEDRKLYTWILVKIKG